MQILAVDDEVVSRTKMELLMQRFGDCKIAENGQQALDMFKQALDNDFPYDLIMLDIDMPGMNGTEVLQQIREIERNTYLENYQPVVVVMVTAQKEKDIVVNSISAGCNDYVAKPFCLSTIHNKLIKLGLIGDSRKSELNAETIFKKISNVLQSGSLTLPTLPHVAVKFRGMVRDKADINEMCTLLKQDMTIGSKLISVANSALYRGYRKTHTIEQAVNRIGLDATEQIVNTIANKRMYTVDSPKFRMVLQHLWKHSLACAYAADIISKALTSKLTLDMFTAGLFHDIGALILIHIIAEMEKRRRFAEPIKKAALAETIHDYHGMFGAKLLERWEFDEAYTQIALYHNTPQTAEMVSDELMVVHLANLAAKSAGFSTFEHKNEIDLLNSISAQHLKLKGHEVAVLEHKIKSQMELAEKLLGE